MSNQKIAKFFLFSLVILLISYLVNTHYAHIEKALLQISWKQSLLLIFMQIPAIAFTGYPLKLLLHQYNIKAIHWISMSFISYLVNYLLPCRPGIPFRYFYLQKYYQQRIPLLEYSVVTIQYFLLLMLTGGMLLFIYWPFDNWLPAIPLYLQLFGLLSSIAGFLWVLGKKHIRQLPLMVLGYLIIYMSMSACFYLAYNNIHAPISWTHAIILTITWNIISSVPITPGNIGVSEAFFVFLSHYFLNDVSIGLSAVLLFRISQLLTTLLIGVPMSLCLVGRWLPDGKTLDRALFKKK
jgi:uncharacterized membrane protein YbhN (UPF0104 family)